MPRHSPCALSSLNFFEQSLILYDFLHHFGSFGICLCMSFANRFVCTLVHSSLNCIFFYPSLERPSFISKKIIFLSKLKSYICLIFDLLFSYSLVNVQSCASRSFLSTIKYPSMHLNYFKYIHQYLICGGPEWARTTDLALIRRTL